ncbi:scavenger receptor cysteine-rich type 1 protein M130 [Oncorhynchus tshawytscha]|uniref:SRCR domain-containing protein n=1 Tax=Oncorhynchus tshawytscha TaxID=74940 RepID=A0A8C8F4J3_ONCTS|nr:scavenger receptor cysteine-rich type 1 protein M130 [Oncorhynchus tshawytscha]
MWFLLLLWYASSPHLSSTQVEDRLILQGGDGPCEGYVEVFHDGKWGIVGDQKWQLNNEKVICKSIGCGTSISSKDLLLKKVRSTTWMNEVECNGNEKYLWDCMFPGWNRSSNTKDTVKKITCSDKIQLELESLPGVRCAGTLRYKKMLMGKVKETGYFCNPKWDKKQADIVCEHLKCGQSKGLPPARMFSQIENPVVLKPTHCSNTEHQKHIWQCITSPKVVCTEPVSVICSDHHNFRLQGGSNVCSGQLEVEEDEGVWKPVCQSQYKLNKSRDDLCSHMRCGKSHSQENMVCDSSKNISLDCTDKINISLLKDDQSQNVNHCFGSVHFNHSGTLEAVCSTNWDEKDGRVVCRELGCGEVVLVGSGSKLQKDGKHDLVDCKDSEASLWHCLAMHNKNPTSCRKASVLCSGSVKVRLSDGPGRCAGRVEIQHEGVWKSVRESNWKEENSKVICNQMICGDALANTDSFIQGTSQVLSNEVICTSNSKSISNCIKSTKKQPQQQDTNKMLICQEHAVVFLTGDCSGKVGIEQAGKTYWLSGSNATFDRQTAMVVCQQMDCGDATSFTFESSSGTTDLWKYSYNCLEGKKSLFDCERSKHLSNHSIVSVVCSGSKTVRLKVDTKDEGKCWGKVEVCLDGACGGVCEDAWTDKKSDMLCKDLDCGSAIYPLSFLRKSQSALNKITISSVHRTQQTTNISQCNMVKNVDQSYCKDKPAYVVCSGSVKARLMEHRDRCSGNVQVFYQGNWSPVCKTALNNKDVQNTICREQGCGHGVKPLSFFGPSSANSGAVVSGLTCSANSNSSAECTVTVAKTNNQQCALGGLQCSEWRRMMLKLGNGTCEGYVFVYSEADSRAVSSDGWTETESKVLCKDLGCGAYIKHTAKEKADYHDLLWGKKYSCKGETISIWDCELNDRPSLNQSIYLQCQDDLTASLGETGDCSGKVLLNNLPVCYDNWSESHSKIVCQEQQCSNSISFEEIDKGSRGDAHFVSCIGSESYLGQCKTRRGRCGRGLVSVSCAGGVKFNSTQKCGGNIKVFYRGTWESVCLPNMFSQEGRLLCKELGCGIPQRLRPDQIEQSEEKKDGKIIPETSLKCSNENRNLQHCVIKKNECKRPGVIYCEDYPIKVPIPPIPINKYVGLSLGLLSLVMVVALCFFMRRRFVTRFKSRFSTRKVSAFESGDYEDVETNGSELFGPMEMRDLKSHESESGGDKENGRRSTASSLSYDDIAKEENVPAQPASSGEDGTSSPGPGAGPSATHEHATYEVEEDQQESYDDVVSMITPTETREEIAEVHERPKPKCLAIHDDEDYLEPDGQK